MNSIVCYTCITGNYDQLRDPLAVDPGIDYICFSDTPVHSRIWKYMPIPQELLYLPKVKQQRIVKICPHKYLPVQYGVSIWVDGNILIKGGLNKLLSEYDFDRTPLYTRIHPGRNCTYDEAAAVVRCGKESPVMVNSIVTRYRRERFPEHIGMAETCVVIRRHNDRKCILLDEAWATELLLNSHRDQLSFNYVCWKTGFDVGYMVNQFRINNNEYFDFKRHG